MMTTDRTGGSALCLLALFVMWERRALPLGSWRQPGPAYFPVLLAAILLVLSTLVWIMGGSTAYVAGWGDKRVAALPDVPTFKELGYPDAELYIWAGLFAPRGTPEPVLAKLRDAARAGVADPDFKSAMDKLETPITFKQGEEFQKFFEADARRLADGVRKVGRVEQK